jgi:hypothetical protein
MVYFLSIFSFENTCRKPMLNKITKVEDKNYSYYSATGFQPVAPT